MTASPDFPTWLSGHPELQDLDKFQGTAAYIYQQAELQIARTESQDEILGINRLIVVRDSFGNELDRSAREQWRRIGIRSNHSLNKWMAEQLSVYGVSTGTKQRV